MRPTCLIVAGALALAAPLAGQSVGGVSGVVRSTEPDTVPLAGARVTADGGRFATVTDARGFYRLRELTAGWHAIQAAAIGHRPLSRDSVLIRAGQNTQLDFVLRPDPVGLAPIEVIAQRVDSVLDPLIVTDVQRVTAEELRRLPVTTVDEAIALSAGAVGESYRGGRLGQQAFILDGLGLKNQLDASTGALGVRVPPDLLAEASLITNGFSARYGQAVSALVNLATRDGGERWAGRIAYDTDRPLGAGGDFGTDRLALSADGPIAGGVTAVAVADFNGRLDADPVTAPRPTDPRDPRASDPGLLPHNSGESADLAGKITVPLGRPYTLRVLGLHSAEQRRLYDAAYKYDLGFAPARRVTGNLLSTHLQGVFARPDIIADLRLGYFGREFVRGVPTDPPDYAFGAFTGRRLDILGEDLARAQDTARANQAIPGFLLPTLSDRTPYGVPAFFQGGGPRGDLAWNRFRELRGRLDFSIRGGDHTDLYVGGEVADQRVRTFQRVLAFLPAGDSVPATSISDFSPHSAAAYAEVQTRYQDLALTAGMRYDRFRGRDDLPGVTPSTRHALSPRLALSTVLSGATFVASFGKFVQAPDYQYLVDAAFDDTTRTGRFRQGNPDLGFESSTQYEFSLRLRPAPLISVRANLYVRRLDGLVASVPFGTDPDSSIFGNADAGSVKGLEIIVEREFARGIGIRASYTLQEATANSSNAFFTRRQLTIEPVSGDTTFPSKVEFPLDFDRRHALTTIVSAEAPAGWGPVVLGVRPLEGWLGTAVLRFVSGLPFTRTNAAGDTILGLPNDGRLPGTVTVDLLLRRPLRLGGVAGGVYLDVRNLLDRRNIVAVRRDTGTPRLDEASILALANAAYQANPQPIPYESPRYRPAADLDHDGLVQGAGELLPLYEAAARDITQPVFYYGPPRLVRLGIEVFF